MVGVFVRDQYAVETARMLAEAKGVDFATLAAATRANTLRLFSKMAAADVAA